MSGVTRKPYEVIEDPATDHHYCPKCEWLLGQCKCKGDAVGECPKNLREPFNRLTNKDRAFVRDCLQRLRAPDLVIAPGGVPYLYRWHLVPRNDQANVYLHIQVADDAGRDLHDHPYDNQSVIIAGGYRETWSLNGSGVARDDERVPGDVIHRSAATAHRLQMLVGVPYTITIFTTGPRVRDWGFYTPKGWVRHEQQ